MMQAQIENKPFKWRKVLVSALVGAVFGFAGMMVFLRFVDDAPVELDGSEIAAGATGLIYVLMAVMLGIGLSLPGFGARFLNFEDEEELREQRRAAGLSAVAIGPLGIGLGLLALAGPGGIVSPQAALWIVLGLFAAAAALTALLWKAMDELAREMSRECGNLSYYLMFIGGGGWSLLAHLGFVTGPAPLDWLTLFFVLPLLAAFIAAGRRGLMVPR